MSTASLLHTSAVLCLLLMTAQARIHLLTPDDAAAHAKSAHPPALRELKGRLAMPLRSEAGRHGDSNTYFVQLPPNQHYYSPLTSKLPHEPGTPHLRRLLPVNFASNGRPARVYHWNMPLLARMAEQQQLQARRHSPPSRLVAPAYKSAATPKPRRSYKKAGGNPKKADSPIYRIARLDKLEKSRLH